MSSDNRQSHWLGFMQASFARLLAVTEGQPHLIWTLNHVNGAVFLDRVIAAELLSLIGESCRRENSYSFG